MDKESSQYDTLLPQKDKFDITKEDLMQITSYTNITNQKAYDIIDNIGGLKSLCVCLKVNPRIGLTTDEISNHSKLTLRQKTFGFFNPELNIPETKSFFRCFFDFLYQKMFLFLLLLATFKLIFNEVNQNGIHFDYIALYLIVIVITITSAISNYIFEKLYKEYSIKINKRDVRVLRNQTERIVPRSQIMVGDIVIIASGDITAVDGIILKTFTLSIENPFGAFQQFSNLDYVINDNIREFPILIHGTKIIKGYALMLVLNVECYEMIECINSIKKKQSKSQNEIKPKERKYTLNESLLYEDYAEAENQNVISYKTSKYTKTFFDYSTPLMKNISSIYYLLFYFGVISSILILSLYLITHHFINRVHYLSSLIDIFFDCFTIIIIVLPSGAELALNLSLIVVMRKLLSQKTIIKSNATYEHIAGINCICLDYYGIITKNSMSIARIFIEGGTLSTSQLLNLKDFISEEMFEFFCESIAVNSIAFTAEKNNDIKYFGNNIECCLIKYLLSLHVNYQKYRNNIQRPVIASSPYISESVFSYTVIKMEDKWEYVRVYIRSTPDKLLAKISSFISPGNKLSDFDTVMFDKMKIKCQVMEENFIHPVMICYKDILISQYEKGDIANLIASELNLICLIGIKDEIKKEVKDIVSTMKTAGIGVKMITGQDVNSSKLIAKSIELISDESNVHDTTIMRFIDSESIATPVKKKEISYKKKKKSNDIIDANEELKKYASISFNQSTNMFTLTILNRKKFNKTIDKSAVISNASSKDKFIIVSALRKRNISVAVIGDGISDSIPMKAANIGVSMGKNSNDISKDSSKIILVDNNLNGLVDAIIYGRNIYDNIRKFFQFQISSMLSIVFVLVMLSSPLYGMKMYHSQILYVNLIVDIVETIAIVWGEPAKEILLSKPSEEYSIHKGIIGRNLFTKIIIEAFLQFIVIFVIIEISPFIVSIYDIDSIIFNAIVYSIVFNSMIAKIYNDGFVYFITHLKSNIGYLTIQFLILLSQCVLSLFMFSSMKITTLSLYDNIFLFFFSSLALVQLPIVNYMEEKRILFSEEEEEEKVSDDVDFVNVEIEEEDNENVSLLKTPNLIRMGSSLENSSIKRLDEFFL